MDKHSKAAFSLNKTNFIFILVHTLIATVLFVIFQDFSPRQLGQAFGGVFGTVFLGLIIAYLGWILSSKNKTVAVWSFNAVVVMMTAFLPVIYYQQYQTHIQAQSHAKSQALNYNKQSKAYRQLVNSDASDEEIAQAYKQLNESGQQAMESMINNTQGTDREYLLIIEAYSKEVEPTVIAWNQSFDQFLATDFLDLAAVKSDPSTFENHKSQIDDINTKTEQYKTTLLAMEATIRARLKPLNLSLNEEQDILEPFKASPKTQITKTVNVLNALLKYNEYTQKLLNLLQNNTDQWNLESGRIVFNDNLSLELEYSRTTDTLKSYEETLNNKIEELTQ